MAKEVVKERSTAELPDGRIVIVAAGDPLPPDAKLVGPAPREVRTTAGPGEPTTQRKSTARKTSTRKSTSGKSKSDTAADKA